MENKYPLLTDRIQSTFIDSMLIIILMFTFTAQMDRFDNVPDWVRGTLLIGLFFAYEPLCMTFGCTLGNYLKKLRIRKHNDITQRINILQAIVRYPVKLILGWVSFLTINTNPEKRAIHDIFSGSIVIKL